MGLRVRSLKGTGEDYIMRIIMICNHHPYIWVIKSSTISWARHVICMVHAGFCSGNLTWKPQTYLGGEYSDILSIWYRTGTKGGLL